MANSGVTLPPSLDEFLEWERLQASRHELIDGLVIAMAGGTADHNTIVHNLVAALRSATHQGPCRVFAESMKVIVDDAMMYPDVVVTCVGVEPKADLVREPVLIVEVLSRSTHEIDRGRKWLAYQQLESLRQYVLISQDEARVETYARTEEGWAYRVITGASAAVTLEPAGASVPLTAIYEDSSVGANAS
jgi:Uma2 family endonuclease